jgi:hypothetical protein
MLKISLWPLVAVCAIDKNLGKTSRGVYIFHMEKQSLVRFVGCEHADDVKINGDMMMVSGITDIHSWKVRFVIEFWKWVDFMDLSKRIDEQVHRQILASEYTLQYSFAHQLSIMVGSDVLTIEGDKFVQRSFWP